MSRLDDSRALVFWPSSYYRSTLLKNKEARSSNGESEKNALEFYRCQQGSIVGAICLAFRLVLWDVEVFKELTGSLWALIQVDHTSA